MMIHSPQTHKYTDEDIFAKCQSHVILLRYLILNAKRNSRKVLTPLALISPVYILKIYRVFMTMQIKGRQFPNSQQSEAPSVAPVASVDHGVTPCQTRQTHTCSIECQTKLDEQFRNIQKKLKCLYLRPAFNMRYWNNALCSTYNYLTNCYHLKWFAV